MLSPEAARPRNRIPSGSGERNTYMTACGNSTHQGEVLETRGAWPFISQMVRMREDGVREICNSRHQRKNLLREHSPTDTPRSSTDQLNRWIGAIFAVGASLFALASVLFLAPDLARTWSVDESGINVLYFAGSIPFTTAAYLQLYQAANAPEWVHTPLRPADKTWFGWRPRDIGWTSCALQFAGTLLFNVNTFDGMRGGLGWIEVDLLVWAPDSIGSLLFLASGYLAFAETCHRHWAWMPGSLSWWITVFNLAGCVAFMISAVYAFAPPPGGDFGSVTLAVVFTLIGAAGFLVGSLLMLAE